MEILPGIEIVDLGLYIRKHHTLIIADVHIGFEEALNKQGIFIPRTHSADIMKRMKLILEKLKGIKRIIISGDLKHEFGTISPQEWRETLRFLDLLLANCEEVILIRGNHDTIIGPIAGKRNVKVLDDYLMGEILVAHGHLPSLQKAKTVIIGHEHPAVALGDGLRREVFKCFLKGSFKGRKVIVLPSFNPLIEGTDVLKEKSLSPFLKSDFEVYLVSELGPMYFGRIDMLSNL